MKKMLFLTETAFIGIARGSIGLIFEHPFETIKISWQNQPHVTNVKEICETIYKYKGLIGFYRGFWPNVMKNSFKNLYRWPLMVYLPPKYTNLLKDKWFFYESLPKILTGILFD